MTKKHPVLLCVLDGFGYREAADDNAISVAQAATWQKLWEENPHALLEASGHDVGLPDGQMGNSEVGHMNLGAGRVVFQDLPTIDNAIAAGEMPRNPQLLRLVDALKRSGGTCHMMGLCSDGGVHSHTRHILALAQALNGADIPTALHAFLDGRDVPPQSAAEQIAALEKSLAPLSHVKLQTVCGRYYAMDRDKRWERVEKAYMLLTEGEGSKVPNLVEAIEASYADGVYDEFVLPVAHQDYSGMKDGDAVLFVNFRADRAREILLALLDPHFINFPRRRKIAFTAALGMVSYAERLDELMKILFPPKDIRNGLGEIVAAAGKTQLRIAETEKYPHVTFFFNGGREEPYQGEERIMVPSPKVATYDLQPEMSAKDVTDKVVTAIESGRFDLIVLNYANPDMVGHTGSLAAAVKAVQTLDTCLGRLMTAMQAAGGVSLITADHGNCEIMYDPATHGPHTAHTLCKVPVVLVGAPQPAKLRDGRLADVAPTLLEIMGLPQPAEMTGESLLVR